MTTEKYFDFELQLFAKYPEDVTIKNSNGNVAIDGAESTVEGTEAAADDIAAAIIEQAYSPSEGAEVTLGEGDEAVDYTFDGNDWTYTDTATADATASDAADDAYLEENRTDGANITVEDVDYTYGAEAGEWTYDTETAAEDATVVDGAYLEENRTDGTTFTDEDGIEYTYGAEAGEWTYETDTAAEDATVEEIIAEYYTPADGDSQTYEGDGFDYTYSAEADEWTAVATDEIVDAIIAEYYTPEDGDVQTYEGDGIDYTYSADNDEWSFVAADETVEGIIAENYTPADGDTQTYEGDGIDYTYSADADEWSYAAEQDVVNAIIAEYYAPQEGDVQEYGDGDVIEYTYSAGEWTYVDENGDVATATAEIAAAIVAEYYPDPADGDSQTYEGDGKEYTYSADADEWTHVAEAEVVEGIIAQYYTPEDGASQTYEGDGKEYIYSEETGEWTHVAEAEVVEGIIAAYYTPEDGASQTYEGNGYEYTYSEEAGEWTSVATDEVVEAIIAEYYSPADGDSVTMGEGDDAIDYTYSDETGEWTYVGTETADKDTIDAAYLEENRTDGETITVDEVEYTYNAGEWTFEETKVAEDQDAIDAAYLAENLADGATITVDEVEYTYSVDAAEWTYVETLTADEETATAADAQYVEDNLADGDTQTYEGTKYTYSAENDEWNYPVTVTTYYQFSAAESSATKPVDIIAAEGQENTSLASPAYIAGGNEYIEGAIIEGVGTISELDEEEYIELGAENGEVAIVDAEGTFKITTSEKNTALGDTNIKAAKGTALEVTGTGSGILAAAADNVTIESFGGEQIFTVDNTKTVTYAKVEYTGVGADDVTLSNEDTTTAYINATIEEGETGLKVSKAGSRSNRVDELEVNGALISGAAAVAAEITAVTAGVQVSAKDSGEIAVGDDSAELADGSNALITGTGDNAAISAIDKLDLGGKWITNQDKITLGANTQVWDFSDAGEVTITADKTDGSTAAKVEFEEGTATLTENVAGPLIASDININGAATWNVIVTNEDKPVDEGLTFDAAGNATLNSDDEEDLAAIVRISAGKDKLFSNGNTGDVITVTKGDVLDVHGKYDSIVASEFSEWTVKTNAAVVGAGTSAQTLVGGKADENGVKAVVTSGKKRDTFGDIQGLSDNATLYYGDDAAPTSLTVADKVWTIDGSNNKAEFDAEGNVTVSAKDNALVVNGDAEAVVNVSNTAATGAKLNGVNVTYTGDDEENDGVSFTLEDKAHNAGISAINKADVGSNIIITGDNSYTINDTFTFSSTSRGDADIIVGESGLVMGDVDNKDVITLNGGSVSFVLNETTEDVNVTLNGVGISLEGDGTSRNLLITAEDGDIDGIFGAKYGDVITTSGDDDLTVSYTGAIATGDVLKINKVEIDLADATVTDTDGAIVSVTDSNGTADVVITGLAFGEDDTLKVSKGTYKIGKSAEVTVNESVGYITFDNKGNASAEDESAHNNRTDREEPAENAQAVTTNVDAYKVYFGAEEIPSAVENSEVAGFESAKTAASDVSTSSTEGGINIYGNAALGSDELSAVTLQSFLNEDINLTGDIDGVYTSVISLTGGQNTMAAITANNAVNHSIFGSDNYSVLVIGENAKGNNFIQAGTTGSYLFNSSSAATTLLGGEGADTLLGGPNDYIKGNAGADSFYDMNGTAANTKGYVIQDYNLAEGDVIIGTKLSEVRGNLKADALAEKIEVTDNTIAIAGGPALTIKTAEGSTTSEQNIIMGDSSGEIKHNVTWAKESGGVLDTSAFGADVATFMLANKNNGMADSITGSTGNDTIFAGGNDTVNANGGHDEIFLTAADTDNMELGAVVIASENNGGRHFVNNWQFGFEDTDGVNILDIGNNKLVFEVQHDSLIAISGNDTISFVGTEKIDTDRFDVLTKIGGENQRVSVLKSGTDVVVDSEDELGIFYHAVGSNSSVKFTENIGTIGDTITLGSVEYESVANLVLANEGTATVIGDDVANEVVELTGQAENDARKSVSLGGGNDSIISTGTDTALAGNDIFFGQNADGNDVISNFAYYQGFAADPESDAADVLYLYGTSSDSTIIADSTNIELRINDTTKLNIHGETNADNMIKYHFNGENKEYVAKIGISEGQNNTFTYNEEVDTYYGNTHITEDTLKVNVDDKQVDIWLDNLHGKSYTGIGVVDASDATNTRVVIAGAEYVSNTLIGGGEGSRSSLWGGAYHDPSAALSNELIGGAGEDTFYYMKGQSSQDVISNMDAEKDSILLFGITLDDISETSVSDSTVALKFKSGGSLTVNDATDGTKVLLLDENGAYQEYTTEAGNEATGGWKKTAQ